MAKQTSGGTRDVTYNLVSVIYHALQGADSCHTYVRDAETEGDQELLEFFREAEQQSEQLAERAKSLLAPRLGQGGGA